eukprot:12374782-Alexandrium_andersonii.AAC.1
MGWLLWIACKARLILTGGNLPLGASSARGKKSGAYSESKPVMGEVLAVLLLKGLPQFCNISGDLPIDPLADRPLQ